jgi:hypothetical protein
MLEPNILPDAVGVIALTVMDDVSLVEPNHRMYRSATLCPCLPRTSSPGSEEKTRLDGYHDSCLILLLLKDRKVECRDHTARQILVLAVSFGRFT